MTISRFPTGKVEPDRTRARFEARRATARRVWLAIGVAAAGLAVASRPAGAVPGPWQRTEMRDPCSNFNVLRNPYFGDLHVHTTYSVDAVLFNTINTPRDAYHFAAGDPLGLPPYDSQGHPTRTIQLGRPLDFTGVTDHSEGFGTDSVCFVPGLAGYNSTECQLLRQASTSADPNLVLQVFVNLLLPVVISTTPSLNANVCGPAPTYADCAARASVVWQDIQAAAEEAYDRTAACAFTSFVAYEWTGTPNQNNLHRNIIFRNAVVPALPTTYIDQQAPQNLWVALQAQCQNALPGCDWLAIPHNSNLSAQANVSPGAMFLPENADGSPLTAADATTRAAMEPLVEMYQHKGSSECRLGVGTTDEQCGFELVQRTGLVTTRNPSATFAPLAFVRNALKEGLMQEQQLGVNPFRLGFIASTDTHNAAAGYTSESHYVGHVGVNDDSPADGQLLLTGTGLGDHGSAGLAVAWSEENSRDALFSALRRRETYGTSGPRHIVRFFAGRYPHNLCDDPDFVAKGYQSGVPMGSELGPIAGNRSPVFAVMAMRDPGDAITPSTPLQRIQIVKGWIDSSGTAQEKVFDVAGDPNNGTSVDLATCTPTGTGADSLCTTWTDPEFDASQRAFYYERVLENPSCRWSTYVCNANASQFDCSNPSMVPADFALCCDPTVPKTIQERSWASPIWYRPEGLGRIKGVVAYGKTPGTDTLKLMARLGSGVSHDLGSQDLQVIVRDDDDILNVTIPAGTLQGGKVTNLPGIEFVRFTQKGTGPARIALETTPTNLSQADRVDHMVEVEIHIGSFVASQSRLWSFTGRALKTRK